MSLHSYTISLIFLCFFFLFSQLLVETTHSNGIPLELSSLIALKTSLNDPQNTLNTWDHTRVSEDDDNSHIWCSWSGVKCSPKTFQITSLDLSSRNLSGEIPLEVTQLSSLKHLNLSKNAFSGPFPVVLFQISGLKTLDISHNDFDSSFPSGISGLKQLIYLDCYSNDFVGPLPVDLPENRHLEYVNLGGSYFEGGIPPSYGSFKNLSFLHLAGNLLNGSIPSEIGFLPKIQHIEIGYNPFDSAIPKEIGLLSSLRHLDISNSSLFGNIPEEIGNLTMLTTLFLFKNRLNGSIPGTISKLRELTMLDLSENALSGAIPEGVSELKQLTFLSLLRNDLSGEIPNSVGFLPNLQFLLLWSNDLTGSLPAELGSGGNLQKLDVSSNKLTGPLPEGLCVGNALEKLILFDNAFTGELPRSLVNCTSLVRVRIENNKFSGSIPYGLGQLPNLVYIDLSNNNFSGNLPSDIGVGPKLENLNISMNFFEGELPAGVWNGQSLQILSASVSGITGNIPDFKGCKNLYQIELEGNKLNGSIPWDIGHCEKLVTLNLRKNFLIGIIPWEISTLPSINVVDLSYNLLSGRIPSNFDNCGTLETFNVSYNRLSGPIPSSGSIFPNLHPSSFGGNVGLCGDLLGKPCVNSSSVVGAGVVQKSEPRTKAGTAVWITAAAFSVGLFVLIAGIRCFSHRINDSSGSGNSNGNCSEVGPWKLTAFQRLNFTADDVLECLAMSDKIIGMGSAGTVYRADMPGGEVIAIKKLWGKQKETSRRRRTGVLAEVEVLGNVRHRNIVRLLGCCTNKHSTMLLYEYMPNGSLDDLLHDKNKGSNLVADWVTRYKIALGVAQGICYLHHDCDPVIVHRDLKPSNILLDVDMEARVADFGVAKLIQTDESMSVIAGSYGYIAPEYAYTLQVDEKSDIYSYGVLLLEILTGKRSVEPEFGDGNSIVDWVRTKIKLKNGINDILDDNAGASCLSVKEEMLLLLRVALLCTSRSPVDRPSMRDVVSMLQEAKPKRKSPGHGDGHGGGGDDHVIEIGGCGGDLLVDKK